MYMIKVADKAKSTKDRWKRQYLVNGVWKFGDRKKKCTKS